MTYTFTDLFCGAGGSSIGLTSAGFELKLAANHWQRAIETHAANFADAEHWCADINQVDMRRLPRTDVLWASPICIESSPAAGAGRRGKAVRRNGRNGQLGLDPEEFGHIPQAGFERTRATFHDVIRATEVHRYKAVLVENVPEVVSEWELFDWWVDGMRRLGYAVQFASVSSAHVGGDTNPYAPQWRDRYYMVFTRAGVPLPDVRPCPLAWCRSCDVDVRAEQSWKDPSDIYRAGRYRAQYVYVCPRCRARVEPYVLPAAAAIDWSYLGERIGDRTRPLAANTLRRIEEGLRRFAPAALVNSAHDDDRLAPPWGAPLPARTTKIGDGLACHPMMLAVGGRNRLEAATPVNAGPMCTRVTRDTDALLTPQPFVTVLRQHTTATGVDDPLLTVTAGGNHHYLTVPPGAFLAKNHAGYAAPGRMVKDPATDPFGTVTTGRSHALVVPYYSTGRAKTSADPFDTITTHDRFALVQPGQLEATVKDCLYRMIQPRESLRAQRFPDSYRVLGNKGEQTKQAGNAVSANVAQWLGEQVAAALDGGAA
jgi:DNA (cytosine-5)-methyltransferase 1